MYTCPQVMHALAQSSVCASCCDVADGSGKVNEEREQTLNQLLTEMDGFTPDTGVVFIGATNRWVVGQIRTYWLAPPCAFHHWLGPR